MTREPWHLWEESFSLASPQAQLQMLAMLAHEATLWARSSYENATREVRKSVDQLEAFNELNHRVTEQLQSLLLHETPVYSNNVLFEIVWENAQRARCIDAIDEFFSGVLEAYWRSEQRPAKIVWLTSTEGGRTSPPVGDRYSAPVKFATEADKSPDEAWSLFVERRPDSNEPYEWIADVHFLVPEGPHELLAESAEFELYEGQKKVATGIVLSKSAAAATHLAPALHS